MSSPRKIILLREGGMAASIVSDCFTFGMLVGSVWFSHQFCGGSYFLNAIILVMFVIMLCAKGSEKKHVFHTIGELKAFLEKEAAR